MNITLERICGGGVTFEKVLIESPKGAPPILKSRIFFTQDSIQHHPDILPIA
jgi:hypothetical protein